MMGTPDDYSRLEHLKIVQSIITRMAQNSFLLKGWSVTLATGLLAAALTDKGVYAILALLPALAFWGLDGYYLMQERFFRDVYDAVARHPEPTQLGYSVRVHLPKRHRTLRALLWIKACLSPAVLGLHIVVLGVVALVLVATKA